MDRHTKRPTSTEDDSSSSNSQKRLRSDRSTLEGSSKLSHLDYTIGWICPLYVEPSAAVAMLDEVHDPLPQHSSDPNSYTLGRIGKHHLVLASLPHGKYGPSNAAIVAANLQRSFPLIRFQLVVGVGGGVPTKQDVRLGDVIVGQKVLEHDLGKLRGDGFELVSTWYEPPSEVLNVLSTLRARLESKPNPIPITLTKMLEKNPSMARFANRDDLKDCLYDSAYEHVPLDGDDGGCEKCDASKLCKRIPRGNNEPKIFYGTIVSGKDLFRNAAKRDEVSKKYDALCVGMEAAGLKGNLPCLIIRGICDYSDSHKNKDWQPYSALTAAAYAKEYLLCVPERLGYPSNCIRDLGQPEEGNAPLKPLSHRPSMPHLDGEKAAPLKPTRIEALKDSLRFDQIDNRYKNIKIAHSKSCRWLFERQEYHDWLDTSKFEDHHGLLWIKGKPGAGKSTLMKFILRKIRQRMPRNTIVSFFFGARGDKIEQNTVGLYRSILFQLLENFPSLQSIFGLLGVATDDLPKYQWTTEILKELFEQAIRNVGQTQLICLIDALDECEDSQIRDMVSFFAHLGEVASQSGCQFCICFASRYYPHISTRKSLDLALNGQEGHSADISDYITNELKIGSGEIAEIIHDELREKASGVFMWVVLVVQILNTLSDDGMRPRALQKKLRDIPGDLHLLFQDILRRDDKNKEQMLMCIQWVLFAERPLTPEELYAGIHARICETSEDAFDWDSREIDMPLMERFILSSSKGLAEITKSEAPVVQFIHESVRDFLLKEKGLQHLWPEIVSNFEGQSQEKLKVLCIECLRHVWILLPEKYDRADLCQHNMTPLYKYAVKSVLYHANSAQRFGVPQLEFLSNFPTQAWARLISTEGYAYGSYQGDISLLYALAERNLYHLVKVHPDNHTFLEPVRERYGNPFCAALATGSSETVQVFLKTESRDCPFPQSTDPNLELPQEDQQWPNLGRSFWFYEGVPVLIHLSGRLQYENLNALVTNRHFRAEISSSDSGGRSLLHFAVSHGDTALVKSLVSFGVDAHPKDNKGLTPLCQAIRDNRTQIAQLLLDHGAKPTNKLEVFGAVGRGEIDTLRVLLDHGLDIDQPAFNSDVSLLMAACIRGQIDIVQLLLNRGAKVNFSNIHGATALMHATKWGDVGIVKLLLDHGVAIDMFDDKEQTALVFAVKRGSSEIVQLLLKCAATVPMNIGYFYDRFPPADSNNAKISQALKERGFCLCIHESRRWFTFENLG